MQIITLAKAGSPPHNIGPGKAATGAFEMTTCEEIQTTGRLRRFTLMEPLALRVIRSLAAILVGIAAFFVGWAPAGATGQAPARPGDVRAGTLLLKGDNTEGYADATRLGIDIDLTVSGPTIRARVTQIFRNPTQNWVEATYVYPLPEGGAVDTLKLVIGDRIVVGEIKERQQARVIYEQAKQSGQRGADRAGAAEHLHQLGRQYRPGRNRAGADRVSGAGAPERRHILAARADGRRPALQSRAAGAERRSASRQGGWGVTTTDPVPDRDRISPPVLDPAQHGPVNPTQITVRLQAGFPLGEVKSHHHAVKVEQPSDDVRVIKLAEGPVPADRDFELTWKPAAEKAPSVGLFRERIGSADYLLAYVTPPSVEQAEQKPLPREAIFVIDNSGSMGGTSMVQAKASLIYALGRLQPGDRFNVIRFDHTMDVLFPTLSQQMRRTSAAPSRSSSGCRRPAAPRWCRRCGRR